MPWLTTTSGGDAKVRSCFFIRERGWVIRVKDDTIG